MQTEYTADAFVANQPLGTTDAIQCEPCVEWGWSPPQPNVRCCADVPLPAHESTSAPGGKDGRDQAGGEAGGEGEATSGAEAVDGGTRRLRPLGCGVLDFDQVAAASSGDLGTSVGVEGRGGRAAAGEEAAEDAEGQEGLLLHLGILSAPLSFDARSLVRDALRRQLATDARAAAGTAAAAGMDAQAGTTGAVGRGVRVCFVIEAGERGTNGFEPTEERVTGNSHAWLHYEVRPSLPLLTAFDPSPPRLFPPYPPGSALPFASLKHPCRS